MSKRALASSSSPAVAAAATSENTTTAETNTRPAAAPTDAADSEPPAAAAASKRPRHFHAGPAARQEDTEQKQEQISTHSPPSTQLAQTYRHAKESILRFVTVSDLGRALCTSKDCNAAVRSMQSIGFKFTLQSSGAALLSLLNSPLARHLGTLESEGETPWPIDPAVMTQLSERATELTELTCTLNLPPHALSLPHKLKVANFALSVDPNAEQVHALFVSLNRLARIEEVTLNFDSAVPAAIDFALLHPPTLRSLSLSVADSEEQLCLTDQQLDSFRTPFFANLDCLRLSDLPSDRLLWLLREPHALRWKEIAQLEHSVEGAADNAKAWTSLTRSLSTLIVWPAYGDISFLPQLQCLSKLHLSVRDPRTGDWTTTADNVLAAFGCPLLTELRLQAPLTCADMAVLLPRIPLLTHLELACMRELESLAFFSAATATHRNLKSLTTYGCNAPKLPISELVHLLSLRSLTSLDIGRSFVEPLDSLGLALFAPNSTAFPALKHFGYFRPCK